MKAQRKLKVGVATFPYAGTSSGSSLCWDIVPWLLHVQKNCAIDPRVSDFVVRAFNDTPITMTRNQAVLWARREKIDILVMVDADMSPDCELGRDPQAKPFFASSLGFLCDNWDDGPHIVCAPYCGPPPISNPYVFRWQSGFDGLPDAGFKLEMISREEAATLGGIHPAAALPTGLIMFDMRAFELTDPHVLDDQNGWFYYEWTSAAAADKGSTEDVTATRDLSLAAHAVLGREICFCNWDAWAGHNKVYAVGKPRPLGADAVSGRLAKAFQRGVRSDEQFRIVNYGGGDGDAGTAEAPATAEPVECSDDRRVVGRESEGVRGGSGVISGA